MMKHAYRPKPPTSSNLNVVMVAGNHKSELDIRRVMDNVKKMKLKVM